MNDEIDYTCTWYPTHIIGKDNKPYRVFIGASNTMIHGLIGLYIRDEDYKHIRHDKAYIFIHNPEYTGDEVRNIDWDEIPDVSEQKSVNREHMHLWKEEEFEGEA